MTIMRTSGTAPVSKLALIISSLKSFYTHVMNSRDNFVDEKKLMLITAGTNFIFKSEFISPGTSR